MSWRSNRLLMLLLRPLLQDLLALMLRSER